MKAITTVQTSPNVNISRNSNGHVSVLRDATVRWLGRYCVCWCDLDPIEGQSQGDGAFDLPTIIQAVHAGGDDCSPLAGLSGVKICCFFVTVL